MFTSTFVFLAVSASAMANIFVTSPVASSTFVGGQQATVSWDDDNTAPLLAAFGNAEVSIYAGNSQQQTLLQTITPSVNVATTQSIVFTPDPTIGPNANEYFIRFQSLALMDATAPMYPALAFSAKFTMSGMTGTFNSTVQDQINGQSTAPIGGTAATTSTGAVVVATTPAAASTTPSGSAISKAASVTSSIASKTSAAAGAAKTNGAGRIAGAGMAAFAGLVIAAFSGMLC